MSSTEVKTYRKNERKKESVLVHFGTTFVTILPLHVCIQTGDTVHSVEWSDGAEYLSGVKFWSDKYWTVFFLPS